MIIGNHIIHFHLTLKLSISFFWYSKMKIIAMRLSLWTNSLSIMIDSLIFCWFADIFQQRNHVMEQQLNRVYMVGEVILLRFYGLKEYLKSEWESVWIVVIKVGWIVANSVNRIPTNNVPFVIIWKKYNGMKLPWFCLKLEIQTLNP